MGFNSGFKGLMNYFLELLLILATRTTRYEMFLTFIKKIATVFLIRFDKRFSHSTNS